MYKLCSSSSIYIEKNHFKNVILFNKYSLLYWFLFFCSSFLISISLKTIRIKSKKYKSLEPNSYSVKKINNFFTFKNAPKNLKENDEYFYKIVFKSKPLFKLDQKVIIDNKYNMIYAENEQQYKNIIEKQYKRLIS